MSNSTNNRIYVKHLSFENVRCFSDKQELNFVDTNGSIARWTLILGENGVGKTTLLQSLLRMQPVFNRQSEDQFDQHLPNPVEPELASEGNNAVLQAFARNDASHARVKAQFLFGKSLELDCLDSDGETLATMFKLTLNDKNEIEKVDFEGNLKEYVDYEEPLVLAYGAGRYPVSANLGKYDRRSSTQYWFEDMTELPDTESRLMQLDYSALKDRKNAKFNLRQLKSIVAKVLPDAENENSIQIVGSRSENSSQVEIQVETPYGSVPYGQLSMGYRMVFAWVVDIAWNLLRKFPESEQPFCESAIVLVDEIDLHLHPRWQREIRKNLTECFPNVQFIVTSNSPLMVLDSLDAKMAVIRREGDRTVIESEHESVEEWRLDQVITSPWFGFESARHPKVEEKMLRLRRLSQKQNRSLDEQGQLDELDRWLGKLPTAESLKDQQLMDSIRELVEQLQDNSDRQMT